MTQLFTHIPVNQRVLRTAQIPAQIQNFQEDGLSGLVQILDPSGIQATLLFVEGMSIRAAMSDREGEKEIHIEDISAHIPGKTITLRISPLPLEGVRIAKSILEWRPPAERLSIESAEFPGLLEVWSHAPAISIVQITWTNAEGLMLLPGKALPNSALYASNNTLQSGASGLAALQQHPNSPCIVMRYNAPVRQLAPQVELAPLRTAFALVIDQIMRKYSNMVGQGLSQTLLLELNHKAIGNGWEIRIYRNQVQDNHSFPSIEAAAAVYHQLVQEANKHISSVIGEQLANSIARDAMSELPIDTRQLLLTPMQ